MDLTGSLLGSDDRLGDSALAHRGDIDVRAIRHRVGDGLEHLGPFQDDVRAAGGGAGARIGPAVARSDEAQVDQPEIEHRARCLADILAQLRADEDDDGGLAQLFPTSLTLPANSSKSFASRKSL